MERLFAFKPSMKQKIHEFKMLQIEILVYERYLKLNLIYISRYYGVFEMFGQYFIDLEYIHPWKTLRLENK